MKRHILYMPVGILLKVLLLLSINLFSQEKFDIANGLIEYSFDQDSLTLNLTGDVISKFNNTLIKQPRKFNSVSLIFFENNVAIKGLELYFEKGKLWEYKSQEDHKYFNGKSIKIPIHKISHDFNKLSFLVYLKGDIFNMIPDLFITQNGSYLESDPLKSINPVFWEQEKITEATLGITPLQIEIPDKTKNRLLRSYEIQITGKWINPRTEEYFILERIGNNYYEFTSSNNKKTLFFRSKKDQLEEINFRELRTNQTLKISSTWSLERLSNYYGKSVFKKDFTTQLQSSAANLESHSILLRQTFNEGIIGTDYIPPIYSSYNAGKTYTIGDTEIKEQDWKQYLKKGGYNQNVNGFTCIYQFINKSDKFYIIDISIFGTSKFPKTVRKFWSIDDYKTIKQYTDLNTKTSIILKPNNQWKDQIIVGIEKPKDFSILVDNIHEVNESWVLGLQDAINSESIEISQKYLTDSRSKGWIKEIAKNLSRLKNIQESKLTDKYSDSIKYEITVQDELMFDPDFDSKITISLENKSHSDLQVTYNTNTGKHSTSVRAKQIKNTTHTIKGFGKDALFVEIVKITDE